MMNILIVSSSANGDASVSNGLAGRFVDGVRERDPGRPYRPAATSAPTRCRI